MIAVSDTGPLIALAKIHQLILLKSLFDKVYITPSVFRELMAKTGDEADEIERALKEFVIISEVSTKQGEIEHILKELGAGEKQSIEYTYANKNIAYYLWMIKSVDKLPRG